MPEPIDTLSPDQREALSTLHQTLAAEERVLVLVGPAGSGKTTLLRALLSDLRRREVALLCPTGKAAARLTEVTGRPAQTIHRAIYGRVSSVGDRLVFGGKRAPCPPGGLVICDEASMVDTALHEDLLDHLPPGAQILYVGDREQLPPVRGAWGPDFTAPTAALETIHRQAEASPILGLATAIRRGQRWNAWRPGRCERLRGDPAAWLTEALTEGADATLITATNQRRRALNANVRRALGRDGPLAPGDRLVCLYNNIDVGMMNGEVDEVVTARPSAGRAWLHGGKPWEVKLAERGDVIVNTVLLGAPLDAFRSWRGKRSGPLERALHVDYGFCLTVHKAQGSQWDRVGFVSCGAFRRMRDRKRLAYTAVTRASERLTIFMED